jgi:predicted amidohydrolase YtcJ
VHDFFFCIRRRARIEHIGYRGPVTNRCSGAFARTPGLYKGVFFWPLDRRWKTHRYQQTLRVHSLLEPVADGEAILVTQAEKPPNDFAYLLNRLDLRRTRWVLCVALMLAVHLPAIGESPRADLILVNGSVFTSSAAHLHAEAIAIRGARIIAVGNSDEIQAFADSATKRIDLGGRLVIPGLNDAHLHLSIYPPDTTSVDHKSPDPTWTELTEVLAAKAAATPSGTLLVTSIGATIFNDKRVDRAALDKVTLDHPVVLSTVTGHAEILNTAALTRVGIGENVTDPMGGRFERDDAGRLTGVAREYAASQVDRRLADSTSDTDGAGELQRKLAQAAAWGITSIQDMSDAIEPGKAVRLLSQLPTPIRVRIMRMPPTTPSGRDTHEGRSLAAHPAPLVSVSGTKWYLDGVPLEFTLDSRGSHRDASAQGFDANVRELPPLFDAKELQAMLREARRFNDPLLLHVAGYPATAAMLTAMEETGGAQVWARRRVRFEHGDGIFPDLIPRVKALGVVVVQNPTHFVTLGDDVVKISQPVKSLVDAGVALALGSDGPLNPYLNIMLAVTHPRQPSEGLTREQAVIAHTRGSAYAEFAEADKGSLEPGKLADLAVLSQDIFTVPLAELPATRALLTIVDGKVVYDAKMLTATRPPQSSRTVDMSVSDAANTPLSRETRGCLLWFESDARRAVVDEYIVYQRRDAADVHPLSASHVLIDFAHDDRQSLCRRGELGRID